MRYNLKNSKERPGQERIVKKFALLPIKCSDECGREEIRFGEHVTIRQVYAQFGNSFSWCNAEFID